MTQTKNKTPIIRQLLLTVMMLSAALIVFIILCDVAPRSFVIGHDT